MIYALSTKYKGKFLIFTQEIMDSHKEYSQYVACSFPDTNEGKLQLVEYCANQQSVDLGIDENDNYYTALYKFFNVLGDNVTQIDATLIEGVYSSFNLKTLRNNLEQNIKDPKGYKNDLFVHILARFPSILGRMTKLNQELCEKIAAAIIQNDYQTAVNLLPKNDDKGRYVTHVKKNNVWKYVNFNENSSYSSSTSYEYIDQDIYKKETFIDQDTYIPTIFKHYNPTRNSYKYNGNGCIEIQDKQLSKRVIDLENYIWGLKYIHDGDDEKREYKKQLTTVFNSYQNNPRMREFQRFDNLPNYQDYKGIARYICDLVSTFKLNPNIKYVLMPYPSSKMGNTNMVQIISKILGADPEYSRYFIDGSDIVERIADEASAHGGNNKGRNATERMKSLEIKTDKVKQYEHENVIFVVFDDVTTTGSSLEALDTLLQNKGIKNIINFVFGKSLSWYSFIEQKDFKFYSNNLYNLYPIQLDKVENIVWDLDNTLKAKGDTNWYGGLDKILNDSRFKHIIVTNRARKNMREEEKDFLDASELKRICGHQLSLKIKDNDWGHTLYWNYDFLYNNDDDSKKIKEPYFSKPSSEPIHAALFLLGGKGPYYTEIRKNTIGVGNNEADIAAYKRAGIYSVLVRWGNEAKIEDTFGADACFDTVEDFTKWLQY
ncbi:hypothetical protein SN4111_19280 [Ligilactobacillus agilis]|uniref:hypothetical protein n=1 Tax=Ligilactobacillus agilis TaxID=1601 RepID=UPI001437F89C|nr:hypothetical protein [Ligilactobacillus agilis]GET15666.1 hypothetical protein SN4111_19280 [Ligilactobacillus agilis]